MVNEAWFNEAMAFLRAHYPSQWMGGADEWKVTCRVYCKRMGDESQDVLQRTFSLAASAYPDKFPSLEQIRKLIPQAKRELGMAEAAKRPVLPGLPPAPLEEASEFEKLARQWEEAPPSDGSACVGEILSQLSEKLG